MYHIFKAFTDIVVEEPQTIGFLTEILNNTLTWVISLGGAGVLAISNIMSKFLPSKDFKVETWKEITDLKQLFSVEKEKIEELETAQLEYQQVNDELLIELAKLSPNTKAKELLKKLEEKKQELTIQQKIQDKVNSAIKAVEEKTVSILKKKE
jgi:hypothetical protein